MIKGNLLRSLACLPIAIYNPKNIMLQRTGSKEDGSGSFAISLVDRETLGWYPEY